ncbi:1-deoxy-D-xylulose-5-phosphate reductoisomerase [Cerasicoccus arenae]|uniref:1-deoxy-D-xylulose 5-phosphate reductoisomerase n=1 Tax=Cerasicoccus arenae TaxID=424488 RepID=A0A8J3DMA7_9BACT|nr:1-deoxy-D-xylulose-5-phosphate reductoisomerase [Cerasicoccus arenae]MBK1859381.1 1-deoxy-D-xylulose-5-phosphate reductoisomerase [Cerasicoccus arenae]GHC10648.1 1-deoxy-D-xylulose 5-phosphate reductoisomerase [Cerasicoccus arenae]
MSAKKIVLLGATGSIGESTRRVVAKHPDRLNIVGIAGRTRWRELAQIAHEFDVRHVSIFDETAFNEARASGAFPEGTTFYCGLEGLTEISCLPEAELVVAAIVGTLSLQPTLAAIECGKDIALASKEILVMAGKVVMAAAKKHGCQILPMDSEHNAIFQCLQGERDIDVHKLILTASGGPFRDFTAAQMKHVTKANALKHPNWDMGPKVTIDSSTMANKGLEVIEAHWLFDKGPDQIQVVVHPQSIVHSMVHYVDGSVIAQLSPPSMTFAIQHVLLYPERAEGVDPTLDFTQMLQLDFRPPNYELFPCLRLAMNAMGVEGVAPAVFNASNEIAVDAFLSDRIGYCDIARIVEQTLAAVPACDPQGLEEILAADAEARRRAADFVQQIAGAPILTQ